MKALAKLIEAILEFFASNSLTTLAVFLIILLVVFFIEAHLGIVCVKTLCLEVK